LLDLDLIDELVRQAERKLRSGDLQGAYDDARSVLGMSRTNGRAHYLLSCMATMKGAHSDALKLCEIAINLDGNTAEYLGQLSVCLMRLGRRADAHACAIKTMFFDDVPGIVLEQLSFIFHAVADFNRVLEAQKRLLVVKPNNSVVLANIGATYFLCGRPDEARAALEEAIRLDPRNTRAYGSLCGLRTARAGDNYIDAMKGLIGEERNLLNRITLHYALASEYEDLGMTEEAFASLKKGKDALIAETGYTVNQDIDMFAAIDRYVDADIPAPAAFSPARPIFVVGMPRSGTTVVERILTNCGGVVSIGECIEFVDLVKRHGGGGTSRFTDASLIDRYWRQLPLQTIGEAYVAFGNAISSGANRFLDKLPLNLLFVPLIVRALPNAKIICLQRHPLDTVLGNYRQLLEFTTGTFNYTSSLAATATYVAESVKLSGKLALRCPKQFHVLKYEDVVADPAAKGREIVEFCGLEWYDDAVKIEKNASPVGSASAAQVRIPIHTRFVGRWKKYEAYLGEAVGVLDDYRIRLD
jgi:tetratricopeptide (TPR) repeat protein